MIPVNEISRTDDAGEEKVVAAISTPVSETPLAVKADPEEVVYKEEILAEKKLEEELLHPVPEKSAEEKEIMLRASEARDMLDKMELEHALEESILDSLEKLPVIKMNPAPEKPSLKTTPASDDAGIEKEKHESGDAGSMETGAARSFTEWLVALKGNSNSGFEEIKSSPLSVSAGASDQSVNDEGEELSLSDDELIEKFLLEDPKIVPSRAEFYSPVNQAKKSVMDHDDVVSETLARIYLKQGNRQKARWCYEKLILLHPEKSAFFAALLKEIPEGE